MGAIVAEIDEHVDEMALLIFDDYHNVNDNPEIGQVIDMLMADLPHQLRVVISSRKIPRISLSRLVVQQDVVGISAKHLRFTGDEVAEFVRTGYGLTLTGHAAEVLTNAVQGWIAGVVLSMHGRVSAANLPFDGGNSDEAEHRVFEFLATQVLADEDPTQRDFLLGSSVLGTMTAADCDRLLGRSDSSRSLAQIDETGLFVDRIEGEVPTYLYHDLFRRFLLERLQQEAPQRWRSLQRTAGDLRRERGAWVEAVDHYLLAGHIEASADLLEEVGDRIVESGAARTLEALIARLPEEVIEQRPALARLWARILNDLGEAARAQPLFRSAHSQFVRQGNQVEATRTLARLVAALRVEGKPVEAREVAHEALASVRSGDDALVAELRAEIAITFGMDGELEQAVAEFQSALQSAQVAGDRYRIAFIYRNLFLAHWPGRSGRRRGCAAGQHRSVAPHRQCGAARRRACQSGRRLLHPRSLRSRGAAAREVIDEGERLVRLRVQATAWLGLADILRDTGRLDEAAHAMTKASSPPSAVTSIRSPSTDWAGSD